MGLDRKLDLVETSDEGVVVVPFSFTINNTSDPDGIQGNLISTVAYSEAGEFLCTLASNSKPYLCFFGCAGVSVTADDTDMTAMVDWSTVASAGTFVVRTMTGATQTNPTNDLVVGGFLLMKKTDRAAGR